MRSTPILRWRPGIRGETTGAGFRRRARDRKRPVRRQGPRLPAALTLAACLLRIGSVEAAGAGPDPADAPTPPSCLERPVAVVYLHDLQDQVMDRWTVPEDSPANQAVVVRFRLAEDGSLLTYKLVSWTSRRIANAVELAMEQSGPFGPIPETATCLVGREVEMRFENPY